MSLTPGPHGRRGLATLRLDSTLVFTRNLIHTDVGSHLETNVIAQGTSGTLRFFQ